MYLIDVVDPNGEPRVPSAGNGNGLVILSSARLNSLDQVHAFLSKHTSMSALDRNDFYFELQVQGIAEFTHGPDNKFGFDIMVVREPVQESLQDKEAAK